MLYARNFLQECQIFIILVLKGPECVDNFDAALEPLIPKKIAKSLEKISIFFFCIYPRLHGRKHFIGKSDILGFYG